MIEDLADWEERAPVLSVVIPVYNEICTIGRILVEVVKALPEVPKQIVIVDDRSSDGTSDWLRKNLSGAKGSLRGVSLNSGGDLELSSDGPSDHATVSITIRHHERNRGKGAAVRTGLTSARGDVVVIQDADLEYDPNDWSRMLPLIVERKVADVVYGSRFYGRPHRSLYFHHYLGNRLISFVFNWLYDQMLSDIEVCYKMFTREVLNDLKLTSDDFGVEIEISAQIARRRRWRIYEVGISYYGRTYEEGKKINWRDGLKALFYLFKFRIS
jgi:glycosyltransferase involved in cell wall biosynthesis